MEYSAATDQSEIQAGRLESCMSSAKMISTQCQSPLKVINDQARYLIGSHFYYQAKLLQCVHRVRLVRVPFFSVTVYLMSAPMYWANAFTYDFLFYMHDCHVISSMEESTSHLRKLPCEFLRIGHSYLAQDKFSYSFWDKSCASHFPFK